jgi:hypothetical protein
MLQVKPKVQIKVNKSRHENQLVIDEGMGGGDHQTPQEIGTKCGTNGVMAISHVQHVTSPNPTTTTKVTILTLSITYEAIFPLSQLPPEFEQSQIQPFNQLRRGVTCSQLDLN